MRVFAGVFVAGLVLVSIGAAAAERSEFLYLSEIQVGMTGIGKTIVSGDVISEFAVEVLGIIDDPGDLSDFIVVRVSGEAIGRSGGIAQGMSGSPIYINGKLIGALSRAANWSKEIMPIGLVTPIEPMLAVLDLSRAVAEAPNSAAVLDVALVDRAFAPSTAEVAAAPDTVFAYPVSTPLMVQGLSARARTVLMEGDNAVARPAGTIGDFLPVERLAAEVDGLSPLAIDLLPISAGASSSANRPATLVPGGALGVALVSGDIQMGALGTVTYVDQGAIVGFGHPFLSNGLSSFPLTTVSIIDTMKTLDASFKLGTFGQTIGVINQDRSAAIGGRIGGRAATIDLELDVNDLDSQETHSLKAKVVNEPRLAPNLILASGFEAVDTSLDRIGAGTVEVTYQITGAGLPSSIERTDVFISSNDIAVYPAWQVADLVAYLEYNEFVDPRITSVSASMRITKEIRAIRIEDLVLDRYVYSPGDTVKFTLVMQTYQGEPIVRSGRLTIPDDILTDQIVVRAYGGPRLIEGGEAPRVFSSIADVIDLIEGIPSYDTVTVELFAVDPTLSTNGEALYGVTEASHQYPGYFVYDERDARAQILGAPATQ